MTFLFTIFTAYRALLVNKVRSALTVLGIVIGITAIMLIVSLGEGARGLILGQIEGLGADTIVLRPGRTPKGPSDFAQTLFADSLKDRDIEFLKRKEYVPDLVALAPVVFVADTVAYGNQVERPTIYGWSATFMQQMMNIKVAGGELFGDEEIKQEAAVAVLGSKIAENLFGNEDPVGKNVRIKGKNFRVVAVLGAGNTGLFNTDNLVVVPYTTARVYLSGKDYYQEVMLKVGDSKKVARSVEDIKSTLRELHNITDPEKDDFYIETQQGTIAQIGTILSILTAFLSAVVAIALVVGGIGVMNVMLVSVTERTREIGLRKALGATRSNILTQFLLEAVFLTLMGGVIGIILGTLLGYLASIILSQQLDLVWVFEFPVKATLIGLGVSASVGLVFGGYPAWKASLKSPIEALRYE
jgi:putative ABC transport system permease protein